MGEEQRRWPEPGGGTLSATGVIYDTLQECLPAPATTSSMMWHSATQPSIPGKGPMTPGHYHQSA